MQIYSFSENDDLTPVTPNDPNAPEAFVFFKDISCYSFLHKAKKKNVCCPFMTKMRRVGRTIFFFFIINMMQTADV